MKYPDAFIRGGKVMQKKPETEVFS